jgi:hypothetical protein
VRLAVSGFPPQVLVPRKLRGGGVGTSATGAAFRVSGLRSAPSSRRPDAQHR